MNKPFFTAESFEGGGPYLKPRYFENIADRANVLIAPLLEELERVKAENQPHACHKQFNTLEQENSKLRAALVEAIKLMAKPTPTGMGGTPDMFGPVYTDAEIKAADNLDCWDHYEWEVRRFIDKHKARIDEALGENKGDE